jgi:hypothetical protein
VETISQEVGENPVVRLVAIGGDLRLTGREGTTLEAQASPRGELEVRSVGGTIEISSRAACLIFLPEGSQVSGGAVAGDARITGLRGDLKLETVGGDLSLRRVGRCEVARAGGDLGVHRVRGDLSVAWVGGDAQIEEVEGNVSLPAVGGALELLEVTGSVNADVGGDVSLTLSPPRGSASAVKAGGDLVCRLSPRASVRLRLRAGGDLHAAVPGERVQSDGELIVEIGGSAATADLTAAGDLSVHPGGPPGEAGTASGWADDLQLRVEAQVDAALAEVEASLGSLEARALGIDTERLRARVRRAAGRAQRRAQRAKERQEAGSRTVDINFGPFGTSRPTANDEERLAVLRMLEQGTITLEQAETLLKALEGGA